MKRRIVFLTVIILIILLVASYCFATGNDYFKGYGIETWTNGDTLTVKSGDTQFSVKILPKELSLEEKLAVDAWKCILHIKTEGRKENDIENDILFQVEVLATCLKSGKTDYEHISLDEKDLTKAMLLLNETSLIVADRWCGNWDDFCSIGELNKLINYPETSLHVSIIKEITNDLKGFTKKLSK